MSGVSRVSDNDEQWVSVSDLMAALMLIFMFIAIIFIRTVVNEEAVYTEKCDQTYLALKSEFSEDFRQWDVELLEDLTIRFHNPEVLFESGEAYIRPHFTSILEDFIPRYFQIIRSDKHRDDIREIRIEGHTSSIWDGAESADEAYLKNMDLSQRRTRAILEFILGLQHLSSDYAEWAKRFITANGLSSSRLIRNKNGRENSLLSRRVEFRLMTEACRKAGRYDEERSNGN